MSGAVLFALAVAYGLPVASGWHLRQHLSDSSVQSPLTSDDLPELSSEDIADLEAGSDKNHLVVDTDSPDQEDVESDEPLEMRENVDDVPPDDETSDGVLDVPVVAPKVVKFTHTLTQKRKTKSRQNPAEAIKKALDKAGRTGSRPLMNTINVMRAEFCLRRPDLLQHEKCLKFLLNKCMKETSGYGYCTEFHEILDGSCDKGEVLPGETKACDYHDQLHTVNREPEPTEAPQPEPTTTAATTATTTATTTAATTPSPEPTEAVPDSEEDDDDGEGSADLPAASPAAVAIAAPAPGPPGPGPAPLPPAHADITNFDKKLRDLPEQGYDEHSDPKWVQHNDFDTQTEDWRNEWPSWDETEGQSTDRICEERPDHLWCKLWLKDRAHGGEARRVPAAASRSSSAQHEHVRVKRVAVKKTDAVKKSEEEAVKKAEASTENLEDGADATGDQAVDAADELSEAGPPGMFPTEEDIEADQKRKDEHMSQSGQDLPPGMLTPPDEHDDVQDDLAFKVERKKAQHETAFGDDDDFVSDNDEAVDVSLDEPDDLEDNVDSSAVADASD